MIDDDLHERGKDERERDVHIRDFSTTIMTTKTVTDTQIIRTTTTRHVLKYVYVLILLLLHENFIVVLHMS